MPSTISWLDASSEDQRRMREIIRLFSDRDSTDKVYAHLRKKDYSAQRAMFFAFVPGVG